MKIAFLVPYLTRSQVTRAFPFAKMLSTDHDVSVVGHSDPGHDSYFSDPRIQMHPLSGSVPPIRAIQAIPLIRNADVLVVCKPVVESVAAAMAMIGKARLVYDLDDDDLEMIRIDVLGEGPLRRILGLAKMAVVSTIFHLARVADAVIVASRYLQDRYGGEVMPVPLDLDAVEKAQESDEEFSLPPGRPLIVFVGVVRRHKGISQLVESFGIVKSAFPGAVLAIAGSVSFGRYPGEIMERARMASGDIEFLGHLEHSSVWRLMTRADVLVCPNPDSPVHRAQTPIKIMEYMAAGRPIVSTPVGGAKDVLEDGRLGTLSRSDAPRDIAESILWVLRNPESAQAMAESARRAVELRYSFDAAGPTIERLILGRGGT